MMPSHAPGAATVGEAIERILEGCRAIAATGEEIADEWQYVNDLLGAWTARLEAVRAARGTEPVLADVANAIDAANAEAAAIADPHRAIDWLSTLPQVALVALDDRP